MTRGPLAAFMAAAAPQKQTIGFGRFLAQSIAEHDMTTSGAHALISLLLVSSAAAQPSYSEEPPSGALHGGSKSGTWLFPVERLNFDLPRWLRFGGQFRSRFEGEDDMRYTTTNDAYLLTQFRFNATIQPIKWLTFFGETQDSRVFFNQNVPDAVPYQNTWDIRQAYVQIGSGNEGWADVMVGRQVLAFPTNG